jgi:hypothetical protein
MKVIQEFLQSLLEKEQKVIKRVTTKNYKVEDYKNPPKKAIKKEDGNPKYRTKVVYGKDGKKHLLKIAITKKAGPKGGHTAVTSKWDKK